jgi:hypothetical protein
METNAQLAQLEGLQTVALGRGNFAELKSLPFTAAAALYDQFDAMKPTDRTPAINAALSTAHQAKPTPADQNLSVGIDVAKFAQVRAFIQAVSGPQ